MIAGSTRLHTLETRCRRGPPANHPQLPAPPLPSTRAASARRSGCRVPERHRAARAKRPSWSRTLTDDADARGRRLHGAGARSRACDCTPRGRGRTLRRRGRAARRTSSRSSATSACRRLDGEPRAHCRSRPRRCARCCWRWSAIRAWSWRAWPLQLVRAAARRASSREPQRAAAGARDARDLRAARQPPRHLEPEVGARGPGLPLPRAGGLPRASPRRSPSAASTASTTSSALCARAAATSWRSAGIEARGLRPAEAHLQHLAQDAAQAAGLRAALRRARGAHRRRHAWPTATRALGIVHGLWPYHPGRVRRLHRHAQGQPLPLDPHRGDRPRGQVAGSADPHRARCTSTPNSASPRTGATRKAARATRATSARSSGCGSCSTRRAAPPARRTTSSSACAPELFADRVYALTPQGRGRRPAARRDAAGFRLPRAYRARAPLPRRQGQRPHRAARPAARQRRDGRDHHRHAAAARAATGWRPSRASSSRRAAAPRCAPGSTSAMRPAGRRRARAATPAAGGRAAAAGAAARRAISRRASRARRAAPHVRRWTSRAWATCRHLARCCAPVPPGADRAAT